MKGRVADQIQVWGFQGNKIIFGDCSIGVGIEFEPIDISSWDNERTNGLSQKIKSLLTGLPVNIDLQFLQEVIPGNSGKIYQYQLLSKNTTDSVAQSLCNEKVKIFQEYDTNGSIPVSKGYVFLRKKNESNLISKSGIWKRKSDFEALAEESLRKEIALFERIEFNILKELHELGLKPQILSSDQVMKLMYRHWNPNRNIDLGSYDPDDVRRSLTFSDVLTDVSGFIIGDQHFKVLSLKILPDQTYSSMISSLQSLPFKSQLYVSVHVPDQMKELEILKTQRRVAYSMVFGKKTGVSDLESQAKFNDLENILEEMVSRGEKVFYASLQVILQNKDPEELENQVNEVLMLFREMNGSEAMVEAYPSFDIFTQIAAPNARAKDRVFKIKTSNLCDLVPIYGPWKGHERPSVMLRNRQGGLLSFDAFDQSMANSNQLICGGSGSGKSFLCNLLLLPMRKDKAKIFFVDIGGSYKKLCENLSGQYLDLGVGNSLCLNPFDLGPGETEPSPHKIKFLLGLIEILVRDNSQSYLPKFIKAEIEQCIQSLYQTHKAPRLSDLKSILEKSPDPEVIKISKTISLWCGNSPYGKFLDQQTNIDLNTDITCFDLKNLESFPDLQEVCLYMITDLIWREIQKDKSRPKFVVFDECWRLLKDSNEAAVSFIEEIVRTIRKYYGSMICLTQSLEDYVNSKIASALLNNSAIRWILMQNQVDFTLMKSVLGINESEVEIIKSLSQKKGFFSEVYLMAGSNHTVAVIEPTPLELWIATTDPRDIAKVDEASAEMKNLSKIEILRHLADKYPNGSNPAL